MTLAVGDAAPDFELFNQDREAVKLSDLAGRKALIVFIPFPFTGICEGELCMIRDNLAALGDLDANVVAITVHAIPTNKKWAEDNHFGFSVLSDYWPHGETAKAYGAFNDTVGAANRYTFILDAEGVITDIIHTESLGIHREFDEYTKALAG
ncbi:MAG: redoxin domain-containing protein [bacterium]|nr:redoxin domain-containing protein [bacterium]